MNYKEFTGKTVEEAVEIGLKELGLTAEQADVRVLEEGKKKLFGSIKARVEIAAKEVAEVKVEAKVEEVAQVEEVKVETPAPVVESAPAVESEDKKGGFFSIFKKKD